MDNKRLIAVLFLIIVFLSVIVGVMFLHTTDARQPTRIEINQTNVSVDDNIFSVIVVDSNGYLLSDVVLELKISDEDGSVIVDEQVSSNSTDFDFDLDNGNYLVNVSFGGNEKYLGSSCEYDLTVNTASENVDIEEFPEYSDVFGNYRMVEMQDEVGLIETSTGEYYVLAGDGYYTFDGYDSQGHIQLGDYMGKY